MCADRIDNDLNAQLVQDVRVESYDASTPDITLRSGSEFKASSLNEDKTMSGSAPEKSTIEKTVTHRDGSQVYYGRAPSFAFDELRSSIRSCGPEFKSSLLALRTT